MGARTAPPHPAPPSEGTAWESGCGRDAGPPRNKGGAVLQHAGWAQGPATLGDTYSARGRLSRRRALRGSGRPAARRSAAAELAAAAAASSGACTAAGAPWPSGGSRAALQRAAGFSGAGPRPAPAPQPSAAPRDLHPPPGPAMIPLSRGPSSPPIRPRVPKPPTHPWIRESPKPSPAHELPPDPGPHEPHPALTAVQEPRDSRARDSGRRAACRTHCACAPAGPRPDPPSEVVVMETPRPREPPV